MNPKETRRDMPLREVMSQPPTDGVAPPGGAKGSGRNTGGDSSVTAGKADKLKLSGSRACGDRSDGDIGLLSFDKVAAFAVNEVLLLSIPCRVTLCAAASASAASASASALDRLNSRVIFSRRRTSWPREEMNPAASFSNRL